MEEKELFEDYEIPGWQPSPTLYKILGASALLHLFVFFTLSQFNLLQTKACDSPYVGKVCQVLDVVSLGSTLLGTDPDFVNKDYEKTEITEADITYIDVSRVEPPLKYPEGYFSIANPESAMDQSMLVPPSDMNSGFTPTSPSQLDLNAPQILPTPNNNVTNQPLPDSPFSFGDDTASAPKPSRMPTYTPPRNRTPIKKQPKIKNESPNTLPNLNGDETANKNANTNTNQVAKNENANKSENSNKTVPESEEDKNKFNQLPLKNFGTKYGEQILKKDIDINAPFTIEVIGKLDENGKLINPVMKAAPGSDPKMTEVAKEAIAAFSDSKLLRPLYDAGGRDVKITFAQNKDNLQAIIQTSAKNETDAKRLYNGVNLAMSLAKTLRKGSDEAILMEKAELATQGKLFIINFLISNDEKNQMIEKSLNNLKKEKELEQKGQPNSVAVNKDKSAKV